MLTSPNFPPPILFSNSTADLGISLSVELPLTTTMSGPINFEVPQTPWNSADFKSGSLTLVESDPRLPKGKNLIHGIGELQRRVTTEDQ